MSLHIRFFLSLGLLLFTANSVYAKQDDKLYLAFGGLEGIAAITEDFTAMSLADPRVSESFEETNIPRFKEKLALQLCELTGGPCVYDGLTMKEAHEAFEFSTTDFNAIVEILQDAMDKNDIPFRTQNKLLKLLAPMHRDIVAD